MNLVLFTHPPFLGSLSHPRFAGMLVDAYRARGHTVTLRQPQPVCHPHVPSKWAGYVDQYVLFPRAMRDAMRHDPPHTLYVFCDQALGPWIPHAAHRPHVVHCHDLLALRSALGDIAENPTAASGRVYQRWIRHGFRRARHFISVSRKSRDDLHRFGGVAPMTSEVVYNGLNHPYRPLAHDEAQPVLERAGLRLPGPCLLHVGGGQWYKNTAGVVLLYASYARAALQTGDEVLPLVMVSPAPDAAVRRALAQVPAAAPVRFVQGLDSATLQALYSSAAALLFPSLAEGFGWPILEAMACGCPVVTTDEAPMNEVGGDVATYLPRAGHGAGLEAWAVAGAAVVRVLLARPEAERRRVREAGLSHASRFSADAAIDRYLAVYERVLAFETAQREVFA